MSTMAFRPLQRAAWTVPAVCAVSLAGGLSAERWTRTGTFAQVEMLVIIPLSVGFSLVGALIVSRRPDNRLGWLYLGSATAMALEIPVYEYAWYGLVTRPGSLPGALAAAWISAWIWTLGFTPLFTFGLLLYPDARLPSPRWRWAFALDGVALLCLFLPSAFLSGHLANHPVDNPLGAPMAGAALRLIGSIGFPLVVAGFAAGVLSLAVRWRRAEPGSLARRQVSLLLVAAVLALSIVALPGNDPRPRWIVLAVTLACFALVPAAIGVAVLRHRLYDIDVVLNRSLVYAGLTVVIVVLYAAMVWALGAPLTPGAWAGAVAVGIIAALILPLRTWLQRLVDRAMYGDRGDSYAALSHLTARLQAAAAPGAALPALADALAEALRLPYVAVETSTGVRAVAGERHGGELHQIPLDHHGARVGVLRLEGRDRRPLPPRDLHLLTELARPAGAAVSAAALADALSASRARLVQAREEERRRLRRDLHDGLGPTLAAVALGLDRLKDGLAVDPSGTHRLLDELADETAGAVEDVRRLVHGLRPPALDELGLVGALRQQADRLALRRPGLTIRLDTAAGLPPLGAATEVAAYRIAVEAVTNSVRHSGAESCSIHIDADDELRLEVIDNGRGIHDGTPAGVGLTAMRERAAEVGGSCTVVSNGSGGTRVLAVLPVGTP